MDFKCGRQKFALLVLPDSTEIGKKNYFLHPMFWMSAIMYTQVVVGAAQLQFG